MKFKGRDVTLVACAIVLVVAIACAVIPVNTKSTTTASGSSKQEYITDNVGNNIILPPLDNGLTDTSYEGYIETLKQNSAALFTVAYNNYLNAKALYSTVSGRAVADAGLTVTQNIKNTKIINSDGTKYSEAVSYSSQNLGVKIAEQVYQKGDVVRLRTTNNVNGSLTPSYSNNWSGSITNSSSYKNALGKDVARFGYVVNSNTIDSYSNVIDNGNETYTITVNFNSRAGDNYRKEIERTGGYSVNRFEKLQMVCVIGSDLYFKSITFNETYYVNAPMGIKAKTESTLTETFHSFNTYTEISNSENLPN